MKNNKVNGSQQEMVEMVIKELVEEHTKTNRVLGDVVTGINGINKNFDKPSVIHTLEPDTSKFEQILEKCMLEIRLTISASLNKHKPGWFQLFLESKNKTWVVVTILGNHSADICLFSFCILSGQVGIISSGKAYR